MYTYLYTIPNCFVFFDFCSNDLTNLYLPTKIVLNLFISLQNVALPPSSTVVLDNAEQQRLHCSNMPTNVQGAGPE
jgi:hypothetical protein